MSDEIRIKSVELENYRQYYGKQKIEFSDRSEGFTIIFGRNGEGKSNLLNAISWCLYQEEPHSLKSNNFVSDDNHSLSIMNNKYITELPEEKTGTTSVKIWLAKGDDMYSISRVLSVLKHKLQYKELPNGKKSLQIAEFADDKVPSGCEIMDTNSFVIEEKKKGEPDFHDTVNEMKPDVLMKKILPKELSKYFLLDGEFLETFWEDSSTVQTGIEQISQLHLLSKLENHVDRMTIPPAIGTGNDSRLATEIANTKRQIESKDENGDEKFSEVLRWKLSENDDDKYYHSSGEIKIKDIEEDITKIKSRIEVIVNELPGTGGNLDSLKEARERIEEEKITALETQKRIGKNYLYNLITKSPYIFLKEVIDESVKIIEDKQKLGQLPVRQKKQFAEDLLQRGTCLCGENLNSDDEDTINRRKRIEEFKKILTSKVDLDAAVDMRYNFKHDFIDQYESFVKKNFDDLRIEFEKINDECTELDEKHEELIAKLGAAGGDNATKLLNERKELNAHLISKQTMLEHEKYNVRRLKKELGEKKHQFDKESKKNKKYQRTTHGIQKWNNILSHISQAYSELKEEIREDIQEKTWTRFNELVSDNEIFKSFTIHSDYSVYLLDSTDSNQIRDISAGQRLILTLAFVTTLREPTGYKFPLIMDSPLGKVDNPNRYNIAQHLKEYFPNEQLTLLVTDSEYINNLQPDKDHKDIPITPFADILQGTNVGLKHFKITKEKSMHSDNVGNSVIKPAELVKDEKLQRWEITNV